MSSARQSEVKAWEEELIGCEHTLTIEQTNANLVPPIGRTPILTFQRPWLTGAYSFQVELIVHIASSREICGCA
jgi:hypothetical protein